MALSTAFRDLLVAATVGAAYTAYSSGNARIGVGDSTAVFAASQTDLQAATNKLRKAMDTGYPTQAANVLTFRSTFATMEANFAWNELAVFNAATGGVMMNRLVQANGTKASTETKQLTVTLSIAVS